MKRLTPCLLILFISIAGCKKSATNNGGTPPLPPVVDTTTFTNPILASGPDPWVIQKDGRYYYTQTFGNRVAILKTPKLSSLNTAQATTIWSPPANGPYSKNIWAPELLFLQGKWYAYFAADDGNNANHRIYVVENPAADPTTGSWEFKGKVSDVSDKWAIDANVFEYNGQLYMLWSGWQAILM